MTLSYQCPIEVDGNYMELCGGVGVLELVEVKPLKAKLGLVCQDQIGGDVPHGACSS